MKRTRREIGFLRERFRTWFDRVDAKGDPEVFFFRIRNAYRNQERAYHTFEGHIARCIREFSRLPSGYVNDPEAVEIALFLHDIVMCPGRHDDESRSAQFSDAMLRKMNLRETFIRCVSRHILATRHDTDPGTRDSRVVADIDLSILGRQRKEFDDYGREIRTEHRHIPEKIYREKRSAVLRSFLNRPFIFHTNYFRNRYEQRARQNLVRSIRVLKVENR